MTQANLGRLLNARVREVRERLQAAFEEAGFEGFRLPHQAVFAHLKPEGARIGELSARAQLAKQTMTELVAHLEATGYVRREPDQTDRRAVIIRRTSRGDEVDRLAQATLLKIEEEWAARLGEKEFRTLIRLLERAGPGPNR